MQIIVPVYNAYDALKDCVQSLLKHNAHDKVTFINDGSTDSKVSLLLQNICERVTTWDLLTNKTNLGFVKTANRGLLLTDQDTVLLNSDTLVTTGWFDGLKWAAKEVKELGTATPWSNHAEICSFPETLKENNLPLNIDAFAKQLQEKHRATYPDIPTAVGFCMLITAAAKNRVGVFDEQTFGHGYGEENDFSLRVTEAGLRNVLCDNVYVGHVGNQSFQDLNLRPSEATMKRLLVKHPNYDHLVAQFIENDPLASLRQSIIDKIPGF